MLDIKTGNLRWGIEVNFKQQKKIDSV